MSGRPSAAAPKTAPSARICTPFGRSLVYPACATPNPFRDQVLYRKHNLNARAITSLKTNAARIDRDVAALVADLDVSIKEADSFIATLKAE